MLTFLLPVPPRRVAVLVAAAEDLAVRQLASPVAVLSAHPVIVSSASPVPDRGHASRCA